MAAVRESQEKMRQAIERMNNEVQSSINNLKLMFMITHDSVAIES